MISPVRADLLPQSLMFSSIAILLIIQFNFNHLFAYSYMSSNIVYN